LPQMLKQKNRKKFDNGEEGNTEAPTHEHQKKKKKKTGFQRETAIVANKEPSSPKN